MTFWHRGVLFLVAFPRRQSAANGRCEYVLLSRLNVLNHVSLDRGKKIRRVRGHMTADLRAEKKT